MINKKSTVDNTILFLLTGVNDGMRYICTDSA